MTALDKAKADLRKALAALEVGDADKAQFIAIRAVRHIGVVRRIIAKRNRHFVYLSTP